MTQSIILASSSPYRKALLSRLPITFSIFSPNIDEQPLPNESPRELVLRLAEYKARTVIATGMSGLIIASDQVCVCEHHILNKPGDHQSALRQLTLCSGKRVSFLTSLALLNSESNHLQLDCVKFEVEMRELTHEQIDNYLKIDRPYNCAGSFKYEALGIALFKAMHGSDPTALEGLPLIRLIAMLENEGVSVI